MCQWVLSHLFLSVCVCTADIWCRSSFRVTTFTFLSAGVSKTIDLVAYWWLAFTDCNQTHFCCQFGFIHYIAGGFDGFLSCFNGSFVWSGQWYDLVRVGEKNKTNNSNCMLHCTILTQFNLEWKQSGGKLFNTAALFKQKRYGLVAIL